MRTAHVGRGGVILTPSSRTGHVEGKSHLLPVKWPRILNQVTRSPRTKDSETAQSTEEQRSPGPREIITLDMSLSVGN